MNEKKIEEYIQTKFLEARNKFLPVHNIDLQAIFRVLKKHEKQKLLDLKQALISRKIYNA